MPDDLHQDDRPTRAYYPWPHLILLLAITMSGVAIAAYVFLFSPPLVLPVLSGVLIVAGLAIALLGLHELRDRKARVRITYWDIAGALYFIGCGAAMLGEPEYILPLMEEGKLKR